MPRTMPNVTARRRWSVARSVAGQLEQRGFQCVAVSGSLARGDDGPGSDVDLWAIGPDSGRDERFVRGVPVTIFRSTPDQLKDLVWINRWDVERLVVLHDGARHFARLFQRYARHRGALRTQLLRDAELELERARGPRRVWLELSVSVFRATGIRVPKWKHAVALLPSAELARLRRRLRLPRRLDRKRVLRLLRSAPGEAARLLGEPVPRWAGAEQHVRFGSVEEAVMKVRSDVSAWVGDFDVRRFPALRALKRF